MKRGMSLFELMLSVGLSSLLTLTLVLLFSRSSSAFRGQGNRSEELRNLGQAMQTLSDELSDGSVYLMDADGSFALGKSVSGITVEKFSALLHSRERIAYAVQNHTFVEKDDPPDKSMALASSIRSASFRILPPNTLEITLCGEASCLQTEIPDIRRDP